MSIQVQCGRCGKKSAAPDEMAGRQAKCSHCGAVLEIPTIFDAIGSSDEFSSAPDRPRDVPVGELTPDPNQPRKTFNQEDVESRASTLEAPGVINPMEVAGAGVIASLKEGGITTAPTLAMLHKNEAVIPLDKPGKSIGNTIIQNFNIAGSILAERELKGLAIEAYGEVSRGY